MCTGLRRKTPVVGSDRKFTSRTAEEEKPTVADNNNTWKSLNS